MYLPDTPVIQKHKIADLQNKVRDIVDLLDSMNDATYDRVNDFTDPNHGRYADMVDWLQYISSCNRLSRNI